ncbi:MAG TPA: DoxX family protein [Symbiobacteriaceae bacterium]|jgi:thiosulfate dehydrogenase [quinone] large subunit
MMAYFKSVKASWIWVILRLYIGYEFVEAGWGKITDPKGFNVGGTFGFALKTNAAGAHPAMQPWYAWIVRNLWTPATPLFNILVPYGEFLTGIALILGFATIFAASMAVLMNLNFLLLGFPSTNTQLIVLSLLVIFIGGTYAGYLGVDYWFRPYWLKLTGKSEAALKSAA